MIIIEPSFLCSVRFLSTILIFFGYALNYMMKIDMGIAIVCMTNHTAVRLLHEKDPSFGIANYSYMNDTYSDDRRDNCPASVATHKKQDGQFVFSETEKGLILGAYFYGYIFTQVRIFSSNNLELFLI